jgi:cyclopropane-fatty-acyl-phospholipid synthase
VTTPDGGSHLVGTGAPAFTVNLADDAGAAALASLDELTIAEAYMNGHLDIEGQMLESLRYRAMLGDRRPLHYLFATYIEPLLRGQVRSDEKWIKSHYDLDADFFTLWLDKRIRGYSHAFFQSADEPLEVAMERKFRYAMEACRIRPGDRVLDIGGGWGRFWNTPGLRAST